jgi:hypothetical protein
MSTLFTPDYKVFNDLLTSETSYVIPSYQRPYSWDCFGRSDKNNQVNVMWDDLLDYFESKSKEPYFMGSMVMIRTADRTYEVIDGQQRLTTMLLLFAAAKCVLIDPTLNLEVRGEQEKELRGFFAQNVEELERLIFNRKISIGQFHTEKKVRIERTIGFDFDSVLGAALNCQSRVSLKTSTNASTDDLEIVNRFFNNLEYFKGKIEERFAPGHTFSETGIAQFVDFLSFLRFQVGVIRIIASSFNSAYQVFEILNNRGLPLSNLDLLRNFIIKEFAALNEKSPGKCPDPAAKWQALQDENQLDNVFISRFVESTKAHSQRYSAFNDLKEIYETLPENKPGKTRIELFHELFQGELASYSKIIRFEFSDRGLNNRIRFLLTLPNVPYTVNLLLALCRFSNNENEILRFVKGYEKFMVRRVFLTDRFSASLIYFAIQKLNEGKISQAAAKFGLSESESFDLQSDLMQTNFDNDTAARLTAKYIWALDSVQADEDVAELTLNFGTATLEHIIPQNPAKGTNWLTDFSDFRKQYTYKLGNFTLLTNRMNSAAKNFDFSKKQEIYKKTRLPMTQEMCTPGFQMTESYIRQRHDHIVATILADLGL